ncbi:GGDEF domain-containing protein [Alkalimonas collagenimarina]|uniref:diguanylate cyclase n=1 Tax=Alkalimonas collagenimarina TaxID=400390 RepID=A0ABT9GXC1_9GAMM|nr:GGDEF domain-containing protein [Alkalimonas collagenimarina]MDP4535709.1 GGDEF domain-containing protein [Alkalimonas collagenimarina]
MLTMRSIKLTKAIALVLIGYSLVAMASCSWIWHAKVNMQQRPALRVIDVGRQIEMLNREVSAYAEALTHQSNAELTQSLWSRIQARQRTIQGLLHQFVDLESNFKVLERQIQQLQHVVEHEKQHIDPQALQQMVEWIQEDMDIFTSDVHRSLQEIIAGQTNALHRYGNAVAWLSIGVFSIGFVLLLLFILLSKQNRQLNKLASEDGLTGLHNRRSAMLQGELLCAMAQRNHQPITLVLLDVDHFKQVNDVYGHPAGDKALQMLAQLMKAYARRTTDVLARIGGEEFMLLMPDTDEEVAEQLCKVLLNALAETKVSDEQAFHITASMGLACSEQGKYHFDELYRQADKALYQAKAQGRNQLVVFQQD